MTSSGQRPPQPGLVVVDKPAGMTSHDVVARARRLLGTRKVGHAGTLDPMATGVLLLGVEKATRLLGHLMLTEKAYDATVRLGVSTTTDDADGDPVSHTSTRGLSEGAVRSAAGAFVGELDQVPSSVSAIKVDGRRAYARARAGDPVALAARRVHVESLEITEVRRGDDHVDVDIRVRCSSGTYIRAIARDLGSALGVGGHLTRLRRTTVGPFALSEAQPLPGREEPQELRVLGLDAVVPRCFPVQAVNQVRARDVSFGRRLALRLESDGAVAMVDEFQRFLALYEQRGDVAVPVAVFV